MAAPTQAYPPWLSPQTVTVTQGGVVTLRTSVVQLPQTYYGPSIPLGTNWVYGGSTFPASIATSFSATSAPTQSTATPTTSAAQSSQSQTTASVSSVASTPPPSASSTPSSSPSSAPSSTTSSPVPTSSASESPAVNHISSGLSSGTRLAVILSTILGTLMLVVLILVLLRIRRRARRRRELGHGGGLSWSFVNRSAIEQYVEPTEEGGAGDNETAAFLSNESTMRERAQEPVSLPAWPKSPSEPSAVPESTQAAQSRARSTGTRSDSSTLDSEDKREDIARFNASSSTADAGSLFFNPGRATSENPIMRRSDDGVTDEATLAEGVAAVFGDSTARPPGAAPPAASVRLISRPIATPTTPHFQFTSPTSARDEGSDDDAERPGVLRARENFEEDPDDQLLPPRRLDFDNPRTSHLDSSGSRGSWSYPDSPPSETDERATLLTARRVNLGRLSSFLASPPKKRSPKGWTSPPNEPAEELRSVRPSSLSVSLGGLSGLARGLGRLSWFRNMESEAGPSGTRHSSPTRSRRGTDSGSPSARANSSPRSRSGLLRPPFGSRPQSGVSFRTVDAELGLRPPGVRTPGTGSASGSGSGKSGATAYHSIYSRPHTPHYTVSAERAHAEHLAQGEPMRIALPPDLDLGVGSTIRSVDVLDLPVPERSLPFGSTLLPDTASRSTKQDTVSSKGTGLGSFPPGLVTVPKWDKDSHSGSSNPVAKDVLEEEPPQAGSEWSSLRSKASANDMKEEHDSGQRGRGLVRGGTGQQTVQVMLGEHATSETASIATGPRQHFDQSPLPASIPLRSPRSFTGPGLSLTPRMSMYASSHSGDGSHSSRPSHNASNSGNGSYSSQPSRTAHAQGVSQPEQESDEGHLPLPQGAGYNRASLTAIGGDEGPPQIPPLRPMSNMQSVLERTGEDRETEGSDTSRPGTGTSKPMSELTHAGTFASGSTGLQTTVPSTTDSSGKP